MTLAPAKPWGVVAYAEEGVREWGGGLTSRRILSWLLVAVVMVGIDKRGGARDRGGIGRGESDGIERLAVLMSGDCGLALEQVVRFNSADSVDEGGGTFSWFDKGSVGAMVYSAW